jgi:uncharacterized OB-fold protein
MTTLSERLLPEPTAESSRFWEGTASRKLLLQQCADCGKIRHYPRPVCDACYSMKIAVAEAGGYGAVHSWTVAYRAFHPAFALKLPYILALIDLDEGVRINTILRGVAPQELRIGLRVQVRFEAIGDGYFLPVFEGCADTDTPSERTP